MSKILLPGQVQGTGDLASPSQFPSISIDGKPTATEFREWLEGTYRGIVNWGPPEFEDCLQYGAIVRRAGSVAGYLGFCELYIASLDVAPDLDPIVFGFSPPAAAQTVALAFLSRCLGVLPATSNNLPTPAANTGTRQKREPKLPPKIPNRFVRAADLAELARTRVGTRANDKQMYEWLNTHRVDLPHALADYDTWRNYKNSYYRELEQVQESAKRAALS